MEVQMGKFLVPSPVNHQPVALFLKLHFFHQVLHRFNQLLEELAVSRFELRQIQYFCFRHQQDVNRVIRVRMEEAHQGICFCDHLVGFEFVHIGDTPDYERSHESPLGDAVDNPVHCPASLIPDHDCKARLLTRSLQFPHNFSADCCIAFSIKHQVLCLVKIHERAQCLCYPAD